MAYTGPVYTFDHDWKQAIAERLAWNTNVIPKRRGLEQRIRLLKYPRRTLSYTPFLSNRAMRVAFERFLDANQNELCVIPVLSDERRLAASYSAGATVIDVETDGFDYDAGAYMLRRVDYRTYEAVEIESVASGSVTLAEPIESDWDAGDRVCPARLGFVPGEVTLSYVGSDFKASEIDFEIRQFSTNRFDGASPLTYRTIELYAARPEASGKLDQKPERRVRRIDFETGNIRNISVDATPTKQVGHQRKLFGRGEITDFLAFLNRRAGRQLPFWFPTWERDFDLVSSTGSTKVVTDEGYAERFATGKERIDIIKRHSGTTAHIHRITAAVDNGDDTETLTHFGLPDLVVTLPRKYPTPHVSFLRFCRLEADAVELSWDTSNHVTVSLGFRELYEGRP